MKSPLRRRPSPALVISVIALFVSLSGVSYGVATGFIDSREIKNNEIRSRDLRNNQIRTFDLRNNEVRGIDIRNSTIQGRDVALNTLGGDDINESQLGKVPSATSADSALLAASATAAGSVNGVRLQKIAYSAGEGGGFTTVLDFGGLRLEASCDANGELAVRANPGAGQPNSEIFSTFAAAPMSSDLDFDPGDNFPALPAGTPPPTTDETGTIAFAGSDGSVVTVDAYALEDPNNVRGTTDDCGFFGIAEAG